MLVFRRTIPRVVLFAVLVGAGCNPDGGGQTFNLGQVFQPRGQENQWTILCLEVSADVPNHRQTVDNFATSLGRVRGIDASKIRVAHDIEASRLYYGVFRPTNRDEGTPRFSQADRDQVTGIRSLAIGEVFPFLEARFWPMPSADVGPPEWHVRRCPGPYTLEVAEFYDDSQFSGRKKAAVDVCRILREDKGYEAYYWHGPQRSVVCVGAFTPGKDFAITPQGTFPGQRMRELIEGDPKLLKYKLINGHYVMHIVGGNKVREQTRPIRVPGRSASSDDEPQPRRRYEPLRP